MKRVLILEDKEEIRLALVELVKSIQGNVDICALSDSQKAYKAAMEQCVDLFIIDIILDSKKRGDLSGLLFADGMRQVERYKFTPLIFISSVEDPKMYAYTALHCFGYLNKPFIKESAASLIKKALEYKRAGDENRTIYFKKNGVFYPKRLKDIIYIKNTAGRIMVKAVDDELELGYKTSTQILKDLDSDEFIRCNRTFIVNKSFIYSVDIGNRYITLKQGYGRLALGAALKKEFIRIYGDE